MTQSKLKQLAKLLTEWESEVSPAAFVNKPKSEDYSQPLYGELIRCVRAQVEREID